MVNSTIARSNPAIDEVDQVGEHRHAADKTELTPTLILQIQRAAEQALGFSPIEADDDLFDFGCDSVLCLALLLDIEQLTGRSLAPAEFYDAPTIRGLAEAVQAKCKPRPSTLVLLRAGLNNLPPLVILPGLGSTVTQIKPLADELVLANPVYGFEPYGLYAGEQPHETIQDAACHIIDDILQLQPPPKSVHLLGICFGGLLAAEIARQLEAKPSSMKNLQVAALILVNSFPHTRFWSLFDRTITWLRVVGNLSPAALIRAVQANPDGELRVITWRRARRLASGVLRLPSSIFALSAFSRVDETWHGESLPQSLPTGISRVKAASTTAFKNYAPGILRTETLLITLPSLGRLPFNAARYWRKHIQPLTVALLSDKHADLFTINLKPLAEKVSVYLRGDKA